MTRETPAVRRIASVGLDLAVTEHTAAAPGRPHLVLVHGYPENQHSWDAVAAALGETAPAVHTVTYDVRGAGASGVPATRAGYRTELLVEDLVAVVEAVVPDGEPVHLVGHDWGSVQLWDVVAAEREDRRLRGRIASYTSVSGPSLDHLGHLLRRGGRRRMLRQVLHSWYVYVFHVPVLPELVWTRMHPLLRRVLARVDPGSAHLDWDGSVPEDARRGLNLYRANIFPRMRHPQWWRTPVPVQVLVPDQDRYVTGVTLDRLDERCDSLTVKHLRAGHWVPLTHPEELARHIGEHVSAHTPA